jgi:predicted DNA-binding protein
MVRLTIRITDETHEKLRWLSYKERRSQQVILEEMIEKALAKVAVPKEATK